MKKTLLAVALAAALAPSFAMAEKGDIVVRLRATQVSPDEKSKLDNATFGANSDLKVDYNRVSSKTPIYSIVFIPGSGCVTIVQTIL